MAHNDAAVKVGNAVREFQSQSLGSRKAVQWLLERRIEQYADALETSTEQHDIFRAQGAVAELRWLMQMCNI